MTPVVRDARPAGCGVSGKLQRRAELGGVARVHGGEIDCRAIGGTKRENAAFSGRADGTAAPCVTTSWHGPKKDHLPYTATALPWATAPSDGHLPRPSGCGSGVVPNTGATHDAASPPCPPRPAAGSSTPPPLPSSSRRPATRLHRTG